MVYSIEARSRLVSYFLSETMQDQRRQLEDTLN